MTEAERIEPTLDPGTPAATPAPAPEGQAQPAPEAPQAANDDDGLSAARGQIAALEAKVKELQDQFLRSQADIQNTRRRAEDEMSKARKFAVESFAEAMLPVVDSLEAGLAHKEAAVEQIHAGAEATLRQLKSALERNKVLEINPQPGTKFDPHQHQAISMVPAPEGSTQEANTVVTVLQKGYSIAERVLRPALVTVAAPK
jgi:molecular chaperone GrpE